MHKGSPQVTAQSNCVRTVPAPEAFPVIRLRPHHCLCVLLFSVGGDDTPYRETMLRLIGRLDTPGAVVQLIPSFDPVCGPCPHRDGKHCGKQDEVTISDGRCYALAELQEGQRLPWAQLAPLMVESILAKGLLLYACEGCEYLQRCETIRHNRYFK